MVDDRSFFEEIETSLSESARVVVATNEACRYSIMSAARHIAASVEGGGKLLICGNGGSAADAQHMATELTGKLHRQSRRPPIPALALTTDTSFLTAWANDVGYSGVFARQVLALGQPGDVLLGISTSGRSSNVLRAMGIAREAGMTVIALFGQGSENADMTDVFIEIPSTDTQAVQVAMLAVEHTICHLVEWLVYPEEMKNMVIR